MHIHIHVHTHMPYAPRVPSKSKQTATVPGAPPFPLAAIMHSCWRRRAEVKAVGVEGVEAAAARVAMACCLLGLGCVEVWVWVWRWWVSCWWAADRSGSAGMSHTSRPTRGCSNPPQHPSTASKTHARTHRNTVEEEKAKARAGRASSSSSSARHATGSERTVERAAVAGRAAGEGINKASEAGCFANAPVHVRTIQGLSPPWLACELSAPLSLRALEACGGG